MTYPETTVDSPTFSLTVSAARLEWWDDPLCAQLDVGSVLRRAQLAAEWDGGYTMWPVVGSWQGALERGVRIEVQCEEDVLRDLFLEPLGSLRGVEMVHVERKHVTVSWYDVTCTNSEVR